MTERAAPDLSYARPVGPAPAWTRLLFYFVLALLLRGLFIPLPVINVDEAVWMTGARIWHEGGVPYLDFVDTKPPLIFLFYRATLLLTGPDSPLALPVLRLIVCGLLSLAAYALDRTVAGLFPRPKGSFLAGTMLLTGLSLGIDRQVQFVSTEIVCAILFALAVWMASRRSAGSALLSGLFAALIPFCRIPALVLVLPVGLLAIADPERRLVRTAGFLAGVLAGAVLVALVTGQEALREMMFWAYEANRLYVNLGPEPGEAARRFLKNIGPPLAASLPVWYLAVTAVLTQKGLNRKIALLLIGTALLSLAAAAAGGRWLGHYYLQVIPPLALAAGLSDASTRAKFAATGLSALLALSFATAGGWRMYISESTRETLPAVRDGADFIRETTRPGDRLLVWGYGPDLYERSLRRPATRQLTPATTVTGYSFGGAKELSKRINPRELVQSGRFADFMNDLRCTPPAIVVDFSRYDFHYFGDFGLPHYLELYKWTRDHCRTVEGPAATRESFEFLACTAEPEPDRCRRQ